MATIIDSLLVTLCLDATGMKQGAADASRAQEKIQKDAEKSAASFKKEQEAAAAAFDSMQDKAVATGKITAAEADKRSKAFAKTQASDAATFNKLQKAQTDSLMKKAKEEDKAGKNQEAIAKKAADGLSKVRNEVLGIAAAFLGAAGLKGFGEHLIGVDTALARNAETLDLGIAKLKAWQEAGVQLGGTAEDISSAFKTVNNLQQELQLGHIEKVFDLQLGLRGTGFSLNVEKLQSDTTSTIDKFKELSDAAKAMEPKRAQMVFGQMGFNDSQIRILRQGGPALQKLADEMAKLHPDIKEFSEGSQKLTAQWNLFKSTAEGVGESIMVKVLPALMKTLEVLSKLIDYAEQHVPATTALFAALSTAIVVLGARSIIGLVSSIPALISGLTGIGAAAAGATTGLTSTTAAATGLGAGLKGLIGNAGLLAVAGELGFALGSAIYDHLISGTKFDEWLGEKEAKILAFFGNTEAKEALAKNDKSHQMPVIAGKTAKEWNDEIMRGGKGAPVAPIQRTNIRPNINPNASNAPPEIVAAAQASQAKYGIPAEVTIAQWKLESGNGKKMPAGSNNPFGIKAKVGQPFVESETNEFINGQMQTVKQKFAKFDSLEDAFDAHAKLLATGAAYANARKQKDDPQAFADALTGTYATDPQYGTKLKSLMNQSVKPVDTDIIKAITPGAPIDKSLNIGAQSALANNQSTTNNNQATNTQHVENHIGAMNINAPQAKTNSDIADAMFGRLQNYSFASMSNTGLA